MYKSQREMQRLQPALKALQEKYKGNSQELQQKLMEFYKEHGVNPFASCLPLLIQMPFMIWVYNTIRLYEFHFVNGKFLWIGSSLAHSFPGNVAENLGKFDFPLLVLYTLSMYLTMKLTPATDPQAAQQQQTMSVMTTGMMFFMFMKYQWSAAFIFYWLILNILSAWQSYHFVYKPNKNKPVGGDPVLVMDHGHLVEKNNGTGTLAAEGPAPTAGGSTPRRPRRKKR
jgi:YidC/Oxa1 family membrane protein insertase